jgi:hypothetical protein
MTWRLAARNEVVGVDIGDPEIVWGSPIEFGVKTARAWRDKVRRTFLGA